MASPSSCFDGASAPSESRNRICIRQQISFVPHRLGIHHLLISTLQLILTGGVGGVFIVAYATRDLFLEEEESPDGQPVFLSDYEELKWLAKKEKRQLSEEEIRRSTS